MVSARHDFSPPKSDTAAAYGHAAFLRSVPVKPDFRFDDDGGVTADVSHYWPRSSPFGVPASHRQLLDVDGDGVSDFSLSVRIVYLDLDGNRMRSDGDRVRMRVETIEVLNPALPLDCTADLRRRAYEAIAGWL